MKKTSKMILLVWVLVVLCAAATTDATGQILNNENGEAQAIGDKYPRFSWDTVPLWLRVRKRTAYSHEELARIAEYPVVVFEKANGYETYGDVEAGTLAAAKGVKRINPETKAFFYFNAVIEYANYRANEEFNEHAREWAVRKDGNIFRFKDKYNIFDLTNSSVREWWVRTASKVAEHPEIDGVFIDAICKVPGYGETYATGYWEMASMLRRSLVQDKLLLGNAVRVAYPNWNLHHLQYLDGTYVERWAIPMNGESYEAYLAKSIEAMMKTVEQRKMLLFSSGPGAFGRHSGLLNDQEDDEMCRWMREHIRYPLAIFLIVAGEYSYFDWTVTPDALLGVLEHADYEEYQRPLGRPLAEARRDGYIYTRQYEHIDVWLDIKNKKAKLVWR